MNITNKQTTPFSNLYLVEMTVTMETLQTLVTKYQVTKSGSKHQVAERLWTLRAHTMLLKDLKLVEDFLELPPSKRYKGPRYYNKGTHLVCATGNCPKD